MTDLLPLFPLPNAVLFPGVFLPLHVYEPRYRDMVRDALVGDRLIGMVLLRPGWEPEYEGQPAVYPIGCSGVITHSERLDNGCYNIVLRGVERFRILHEDQTLAYRRAVIEPLSEGALDAEDREAIVDLRTQLESLLSPGLERAETDPNPYFRAATAMPDEDLVNALAQYLDLEPVEKLALLQHDTLRARAASLVELIEMKILIARTPGLSGVSH